MERCDFASIMKIIRADLLDGNFGNQMELVETMFSSYLQESNVCFDMGLLNKWLNELTRVSPAVGLFYLKDRKNRDELAVTMEDVILPCLSDSSMTVQNIYNLLIQDPTISERKKQELTRGGAFETEAEEAEFLADALIFGMTRPFQARDIRKPRTVNVTIKSPDIRGYILDGEVPEPCECFCGRNEEITFIRAALVWYGKLFIEGTPGIGKSEVAKGYAKTYKQEYTNILYIQYSGDLQQDIANLYFADDMPQETEKERFARHDRFLRTLNEDTLLIIDNFDTKSSREASLFNLRKYRCHILITSRRRWSGYRRYRIGTLKDEMLFQLIAHYYPDAEKNKDIMQRIMAEVQWNTLMVELIARLLGQGSFDLEAVLYQLLVAGSKISIKEKVRMNKDGKVRRDTIYAHIQALLELSELSTVQQDIIRCMALVPLPGIPKHLLAKWMGLFDINEIEGLIDLGYLLCSRDNTIIIPRIIQRAAFSELSPSAGQCKRFLESIRKECLSHGKDSSNFLLIVNIIISLMETPKDDFAYYLQFLQDTYSYVEKYDYEDVLEKMRSQMALMMLAIEPTKMDEALLQYYHARTFEYPSERIQELESALCMLDVSSKESALLEKNIHAELASAYHVIENDDAAEQHMTAALDLWRKCQPLYDYDGVYLSHCKDAICQLFNHLVLLKDMEAYDIALVEITELQEMLESICPDSFDYGLLLHLKGELQIYEEDLDERDSAVQNLQRAYRIFRSELLEDNKDLMIKKEQHIKELLQKAGLTDEDIQKLLEPVEESNKDG